MHLIDGKLIGIKTNKEKPIILDDLMEENFLDLNDENYGIYIPSDELLKRNKYSWLAVLSKEEILNTNIAISKYIKSSMVESAMVQKKQYIPTNVMI